MDIGAISLGCDKNRVDTENLLGFIREAGHTIVSEIEQAEMVIINSCAFLQSAVNESIDTIMEVKSYPGVKYIVLCGCLPQRYKDSIASKECLPEVDAMVANTCYHRIGEVVERVLNGERVILSGNEDMTVASEKRVLTTPLHYAYLKVSEGCNNHCTYCTIPAIRGRYRSQTPEAVIQEATRLVDNYGCKELILVAQDLTRYGSDLTGKAELLPLLEKLSRLDINKIRLMYCYPELVTNELIDYINDEPKIAKYIDMPMQHIDSAVLKRMNRPANEETIRARLDYIKSKSSNISIRSTFMVGFPGETDNEFGKMVSFLEEYQLDNVGFFGFSKEDGTAAALMKDQISARVKADRLSYVTAVQSRIMADKLDKCINSDVMVTYDDIDYCKQLFCGHTERNAPEVDKKVYFSSKIPLEIGREYKVTLKSRKKLDMYGVIVEENK